MSNILDRVDGPRDLDALSSDELAALCSDLRAEVIETVSKTGGHLAANLGVVELTVAMLKAFDPPTDKLVWDVGHQAYAYKLLTGRRSRFNTLRQYGGVSGFLKRSESEYDAFGAGHAGTALSAALGMAVARDMRGSNEHVVAIVGDASAGNGIAFEALNNVDRTTPRLIVVLNDNEMSISANVGALSGHLGHLLASPRYNRWKTSIEAFAKRMRLYGLRRLYYRTEEAIKSLFLRSVIFEEMGLRYIGPINGHNIPELLDAFEVAKRSHKPVLLHVATTKGKGYEPAEKAPEKWHGTSGFDVCTGESPAKSGGMGYSEVFSTVLERIAAENERVIAITAAMPSGTGLSRFAERFPKRFFDVGISEGHAAIFAAGLAAEGQQPVFAVYSTFLQRAIDCVIHDICLQKLPVVLCIDRAGIVGDDGPTHHGVFDIALLLPIPELTFMQPRDEAELANMLFTAFNLGKPVAIRYPRGGGPGTAIPDRIEDLEIGKAEVLQEGREVQIWALGDMIPGAIDMAERLRTEGIDVGIVNPRFIKPIDHRLLLAQAAQARLIVTMENGVLAGGFGSAVQAVLSENGMAVPVLRFGWPDQFIPQGNPSVLFEQFGLSPDKMAIAVRDRLGAGGSKSQNGSSDHG